MREVGSRLADGTRPLGHRHCCSQNWEGVRAEPSPTCPNNSGGEQIQTVLQLVWLPDTDSALYKIPSSACAVMMKHGTDSEVLFSAARKDMYCLRNCLLVKRFVRHLYDIHDSPRKRVPRMARLSMGMWGRTLKYHDLYHGRPQ